jgi:RNA polymerase sigma factor (sigma-70 family)
LRALSAKETLKNMSDGDLLERFTDAHDGAAFAVMVRRHGGMVLQVCRSLLSNQADADDAFQATFLVLARRARSIRKNGSLGSWLYGVAYRTALKARAANARRKHHEARAQRTAQSEAVDELTWRESQWILHQELAQLPEKYRAPLVLCYLQGKRQDEAARILGWLHGRLRSMLERARELLRKRLLRRGLGPGAVLLAAAGFAQGVAAAPSSALVARTAGAADGFTLGQPAAGAVSGHVANVAETVLRTMSTSKLTITFVALLAVVALGIGMRPALDDVAVAQPTQPALQAVGARGSEPGNLCRPEASPIRTAKVSVRASGSWAQNTPDRAFDGAPGTTWNAGYYAPQWIEADLGAATQLDTLALHMTQLPAGVTTHEIWVSSEPIGEDRSRAKLAHTFRGPTDDNQRLSLEFPMGLCARYVQVRTTESPSWVAWVEVELRVLRPDGQYLCRSP